jgi:hypothetical protein
MQAVLPQSIQDAQDTLDAHVRDIVRWHFSPETGCPFWLEWAQRAGWDPVATVKGFDDLLRFSAHELKMGPLISKDLRI